MKIIAKNYQHDQTVFHDIYESINVLRDKMGFDEKGFPVNCSYSLSYVINACLFCELCFKALILKQGKDVEYEHDLVNLFNKLEDGQKQHIADETMSKEAIFFNRMKLFLEDLKKEKNNFKSFRYVMFPSDNHDYYSRCIFLKNLTDVLIKLM